MTSVANLITADTIQIYWPEGCAPYSGNVPLSNAETHIAARDLHAEEARVLLAIRHDTDLPAGWSLIGEGEDADGDWCAVYEYAEDEAEPVYTLEMQDDGGSTETIEYDSMDEALAAVDEACEAWARGGEWGDDGARVEVNWTITDGDGDEIEEGSVYVAIDPDHDALILAAGGDPDCDHDWTAEGEGGCRENPGVWSTGGTSMTFRTHCRLCGLSRLERHTGSQRNPGEHDTVEYTQPDSWCAECQSEECQYPVEEELVLFSGCDDDEPRGEWSGHSFAHEADARTTALAVAHERSRSAIVAYDDTDDGTEEYYVYVVEA